MTSDSIGTTIVSLVNFTMTTFCNFAKFFLYVSLILYK